MAFDIRGAWNAREIAAFLDGARIPIRLACVGADGFPRVVSLWHRYQDGRFYCVTRGGSSLSRLLSRNHKIGFEVAPNEPPYMGVRGQGLVSVASNGGEAMLRAHLDRYLGGTDSSLARWLLSRADDELLLTVEVTRMYSWDYRERMADAV